MSDAFQDLELELAAAVRRRVGRRPRRSGHAGVAALIAALVVSAGAVAAAGMLSTGERQSNALSAQPALPTNDPADSDANQRLSGTDLMAAIERVQRTVPLPPGGTFTDMNWTGSAWSAAGVRSSVEYNASCDWYRYLLSTTAHNDRAGARHAVNVMSRIPRWPSFRNSESGPHAATISEAALNGDVQPAREQVRINCGPTP